MPIRLTVERQTLNFDVDAVGIGRDPENQVAFPNDSRLAPLHAVLRHVNGRWIIESQDGGPIRIGNGRPSRFAWLKSGDVIHLTETGPELVFEQPPAGISVANSQNIPLKTSPATSIPASAPATVPYIPFIPDIAGNAAQQIAVPKTSVDVHPRTKVATWIVGTAAALLIVAVAARVLYTRFNPTQQHVSGLSPNMKSQ